MRKIKHKTYFNSTEKQDSLLGETLNNGRNKTQINIDYRYLGMCLFN